MTESSRTSDIDEAPTPSPGGSPGASEVNGSAADPTMAAWTAFRLWARRVALERKLAVAFSVLAVLSGAATAVVITRSGPLGPDPDLVLASVYLNIAFLLGLGALVLRQLVRLWVERRRGLAGARLHIRLALLFAAIAVTPTLIISVFSAVFFDLGMRGWFSDRVRTAVTGSAAVAEAYLEEHRQTIRGDVLAMANDLNREASFLLSDNRRFEQVVTAQAAVRNLTEAVVFEGTGRVYARSGLSFAFDFEPLPDAAMESARQGEVVILTSPNDDRIRALVALNSIVDTFLFVGRFVDPALLARVEDTQQAVSQYRELEGLRLDFQLTFAIVFGLVALLILLASIWIGLLLADRLVRPVSALIDGAERVRRGDLAARVPLGVGLDEVANLTRAFNRMTAQLESQREELLDANTQLDDRRRFTEAVLGGVSSGVIGLDEEGRINLPNRAASRLLDADFDARVGTPLVEVVPAFDKLIEESRRRPWREATDQIAVTLPSGETRTFLARMGAEVSDASVTGYVVTFDDVTELLSAQRKAAWADVARRIAHEIKNPLTPIQLSAERLRRKYLDQITQDPDTFARMTETIVRQVGDIGRMVDEFSAFARMPTPVMQDERLDELIAASVDLQQAGRADIDIRIAAGPDPVVLRCDSRQIRQALTNLLQNAVDAIEARSAESAHEAEPGWIEVATAQRDGSVVVSVADNGRGLPDSEREKLTEPYVTTRDKGTGLGLAIVKKIMEDHGGTIELKDRPEGGAIVSLVFSLQSVAPDEPRHERVLHGT